MDVSELTPELLISAYAHGWFPMAQAQDDNDVYWYNPEQRGILPLDGGFIINRSNQRLLKNNPYTITINRAFTEVMQGCRENRDGVWISDPLIDLYQQVHLQGLAHSLELWEGQTLMGGIYGLSLGSAFFAESKFSRRSGAGKIALMSLVKMLKTAHYTLLDVQYINDHLKQFGVIEIEQEDYLQKLEDAMQNRADKLKLF